jgi:chloramphenicol O-acetyltransferase type A
MPQYLNLNTWSRRIHFEFFKNYANPYFNICARVDVTALLEFTRDHKGISFSIAYHFLSIKAANEVESFRYRLVGDRVVVHERIHAGTIVLLPDESFTFVYFDYDEDFNRFHADAKVAVEKALAGGPRLDERADQDNLIYHSVLPWFSFTSISHARNLGQVDSVPKISFGKYVKEDGRVMMPVSVEVHHALMDGLHVGKYFELFEGYLSDPGGVLQL